MADKLARDPVVEYQGRATVPMGRGFALYKRFNREDVVWVETPEGKPAWITRKQANLLDLALSYIDNGRATIRSLALELKCSPSTVSRGLVKLASLGLLVALTGRGRYAGLLIFRLPRDGSMGRFREAAKAKVRHWREVAERRISRLQRNVASYILEGDRGNDSLNQYLELVTSTKGATLKRDWTAEDVAGVV